MGDGGYEQGSAVINGRTVAILQSLDRAVETVLEPGAIRIARVNMCAEVVDNNNSDAGRGQFLGCSLGDELVASFSCPDR